MAEEMLRSVLAVEAQARAVVAQAERAAGESDARALAEAAALRQRLANEGAQEAARLRMAARRQAEAARARLLAAAGEEARRLDEEAAPRVEGAIRLVLQRVLDP
ncbi:MAG TPA: hypothetical protein PLJ35_11035 [Anaerolineae bacterium]|nr:hypothetical protein [Anaerolineae bacterium]HOQ99342.1 hypothetical protein [Anaerolineae bacterium]HPL26779.1 hypothetical protein [Anaerolineae bacterium]